MTNQLTLSIIIPAYNEEHYLKSCLDSIARQTQPPDEVIVVDNNSTDGTAALARHYDFVTVIHEPRQGRGYARTMGFDAATSMIIGRIDADSVLAPDWVERVRRDFSTSEIDAVTGLARVALLPRIQWPKSVLWAWLYTQWSVAENGYELLWGANMAVRAGAWQTVRGEVCNDDSIVHEDQDVSFLLLLAGYKLERDNNLLIMTDGQTFHYFPKLVRYTWLRWSTRRRFGRRLRSIPKTARYGQRALIWVTAPFVLVPFFVVSLVLWPLDVVIRSISRTIFRSTD